MRCGLLKAHKWQEPYLGKKRIWKTDRLKDFATLLVMHTVDMGSEECGGCGWGAISQVELEISASVDTILLDCPGLSKRDGYQYDMAVDHIRKLLDYGRLAAIVHIMPPNSSSGHDFAEPLRQSGIFHAIKTSESRAAVRKSESVELPFRVFVARSLDWRLKNWSPKKPPQDIVKYVEKELKNNDISEWWRDEYRYVS